MKTNFDDASLSEGADQVEAVRVKASKEISSRGLAIADASRQIEISPTALTGWRKTRLFLPLPTFW